ncbi:MAG TPA: hypothetical protein VEF06_02765 [Bryobacteraceae bacterium]|nr:hypothetical protein [Bryobacteraceae bacterium]
MISANVFLILTLLQYYPTPYPRRVPPGQTVPGGAITDAVATFEGKFKSADKKYVTIELDEGQTMRMYVTGSTKFFRDDKPAKPGDFHTDERVAVDASRDARMNLLAVRVTTVQPRPKPKPAEPTN